jgi:hypothetical protein
MVSVKLIRRLTKQTTVRNAVVGVLWTPIYPAQQFPTRSKSLSISIPICSVVLLPIPGIGSLNGYPISLSVLEKSDGRSGKQRTGVTLIGHFLT